MLRIGLRPLISTLILLLALTATLNGGYAERGAEANDAIERYRKGDAVLAMLDDQGRPITGASVSYRQVTRDFLFGVSGGGASEESSWLLLKEAGINYVEVFLSWNGTESPGGRWYTEQFLKPSFLQESGFLLSGHCLVWMVASYDSDIPGADPWNLPTRVKSLTYDELKNELYVHVYETVTSYKSLIRYWGINEPFWSYADPFHLTTAQWLEIVDLSVQAIKKADPTAKIYMNNILGDFPPWNYYPLKHMELLMDRGIEFDVIGLEVYGEDRSPGVALDSKGYPVIPWVSKRLDQFGKLGKPVILTEVDVTTTPSEKAQAEWLMDFYTMAFAKPYVKGIAWSFGTFDDPFLPKGGLFDCQRRDDYDICAEAGRPREAYYALRNFTSSWVTEGSGTTDIEGNLHFRGFAGNYSVTVTADGFKALETIIHVGEQVENRFEIRMQAATGSETITSQSVSVSSMPSSTTSDSQYIIAQSQGQIYVALAGGLVVCFAVSLAVMRMRRRRTP